MASKTNTRLSATYLLATTMPRMHGSHVCRGSSVAISAIVCVIFAVFVTSTQAWTPSDLNSRSSLLASRSKLSRQSYRLNHVSIPSYRHGDHHLSRIAPLYSSPSKSAEDTATETTTSFTSPVMKVYIEDTDAYAMKYNTNYLRSYERALHGAEVASDSILAQHPDWTLTKVTNQKFKATAALGGTFVITGTLVEQNTKYEVWDLQMTCPEAGTVFNSATVTVGLPLTYSDDEPAVLDSNDNDNDDRIASAIHHDILHRDEFDPHHPHHLPLRSVLNLCERSRSNYIGGPDALSRMQQEDNTVVVVTAINDLCSFQQHSYPRQRVRVETKFVPKRRGLLCEAQHTLFDDETDEPMAQAIVTMVAVDATTKRPTSWPLW